jgi:hypothetical protein
VLLGKLSLMEQGVQWDVQALSTVRGDSITLASVAVKGAAPRATAAAPARQGGAILVEQGPRADKISARSDDLGYRAQAMAVGDLTGDGGTKLAVTDGQTVFVYALEGAKIREIARLPGTNQDNVVALDAADINGNGVAELFATNFTPELGLRSYVLEYRDGKFQRTWSEVALSFRVLADRQGAPRLYAQSGGRHEAFSGPVRQYAWQGGGYTPGEVVPLPKLFNRTFGFILADLENDGGAEIVLLDHMDYLRIFNPQGGELYRSGEHYGGSEIAVETLPPGASTSTSMSNTAVERTRVVLQGRLYYRDLWGDGKPQLVVPRNVPSTGYAFQTRMYDKGKLFGLAWDGVSMVPVWETRELPGRVADFALAEGDEPGQTRLVALVVRSGVLGLGAGSQSMVLVLDLQGKP